MGLRGALTALICGAGLAGCAQGSGSGGITTGSILPSMPSLPSAAALLPTTPLLAASQGPRRPERVSGNLYRVHADDRRLDDRVQAENYALLRAAESTRDVGGTHFVVVNDSQSRHSGAGQTGAGASPGPLIRVFRLDSDIQPPIGAIVADEIIHFFGPSFGRAPAPREPT